jgi:hypothetical protein
MLRQSAEQTQAAPRPVPFAKAALTFTNLTLVFMGIGLSGAAFALGRVSNGPPTAPPTPTVTVQFMPTAPKNLQIVANLSQEASRSVVLYLVASGRFPASRHRESWEFTFQGFTGEFCSKLHDNSSTVSYMTSLTSGPMDLPTGVVHGALVVQGESNVNPLFLSFVELKVCWAHNSPLATSGPYLSAVLPEVVAPYSGTLVRVLDLPAERFLDYTLQGGEPPTVTTGHAWQWSAPLSVTYATLSSQIVPVSAVSTSKVRHDTNLVFWSGVTWGLAGGAAVTVIGNFATAFSESRRRSPATAADHRAVET